MSYQFHNIVMPPDFLLGAQYTITYKTLIVATKGSHEQRDVAWIDARERYNLSPCISTQAQLNFLISFFRARGGSQFAFRCRNWLDYTVEDEEINVGDNIRTTWLLSKMYSTNVAGDTYSERRPITKPVASAFQLFSNGTSVDSKRYTLDDTTGVITNTVAASGVVADLSVTANPDTITRTDAGDFLADGLEVGDVIRVTATNNSNNIFTAQIQTVNASTITLVGIGGGLINVIPEDQTGAVIDIQYVFSTLETLTWTGEFDVAVRFENDSLPTQFEAFKKRRTNVVLLEDRCEILESTIHWTEDPIPSFVDATFFDVKSSGSSMGPQDEVKIVGFDSGAESRVEQRTIQRTVFSINQVAQTLDDVQFLIALFRARKGRATQFNVFDLTDNSVTAEQIGVGDDATVNFNFTKVYSDAEGAYIRRIFKPINDSNFSLITAGGSFITNPIINTEVGRVEFTLGTINCTFASVGSILTRNDAGSFLTDGVDNTMTLIVSGTANNNGTFDIVSVTATEIVTVQALVDETSNAKLDFPPITASTISWTGNFNVPVRFSEDEFTTTVVNFEIQNSPNIGLIEVNPEVVPVNLLNGQTGKTVFNNRYCTNAPLIVNASLPPVGIQFDSNSHLLFGNQNGIPQNETFDALAGANGISVILVFSRMVNATPTAVIHLPGGFNHEGLVIRLNNTKKWGGSFSAGTVLGQGTPGAIRSVTFDPGFGGTPLINRMKIENYTAFDGNPAVPISSVQIAQGGGAQLLAEPLPGGSSISWGGFHTVLGLADAGASIIVDTNFPGPDDENPGPGLTTFYSEQRKELRNDGNFVDLWPNIDNGEGVSVFGLTVNYLLGTLDVYGHIRGQSRGRFYTDPASDGGSERVYLRKFVHNWMNGTVGFKPPSINGVSIAGLTPYSATDFGDWVLYEMIMLTHRAWSVEEATRSFQEPRKVMEYLATKYTLGLDPGFPAGLTSLYGHWDVRNKINGLPNGTSPSVGTEVVTWGDSSQFSIGRTLHRASAIPNQAPVIVSTPAPRLLTPFAGTTLTSGSKIETGGRE